MTFRAKIAELGFEIIDFHLKERLTALGYEFIKSKQVAFKKTIDDQIIEVLFYKDNYTYVEGSFDEYEFPIIEIRGFISAESKQFNKWRNRHFKDEPKRNEIFRAQMDGRQFMARMGRYESMFDEWKVRNKQSSDLIVKEIEIKEREILSIKSLKNLLTKDNKSIRNWDIHLFLGELEEARQMIDHLKITKEFDGLSVPHELEFLRKRERLFLS